MKYILYDIEVTTVGDPKSFNCSHIAGEGFVARGENLYFNDGTVRFSHYALATLMPYIAAKQRCTNEDDWMYYESTIACPDPKCGAQFDLKRTKKQVYKY